MNKYLEFSQIIFNPWVWFGSSVNLLGSLKAETKMNIVKMLLCALLCHLVCVEGIELELFLNSSDQTDFDVACCFERFEKLLTHGKIKQRSAVIVLPDGSDISDVEDISSGNLIQKNPWSLEIWQLKNQESLHSRFRTGQNNYILMETDENVNRFTEFRFQLSRNKIHSMTSLNVCIVKAIPNISRKNSIQAKRCCTIQNRSNIFTKPVIQLHAAGTVSAPFFHNDGDNGTWKGIDVSLITTLAEKLKLTLRIDVLGTNKLETLNSPQSAIGFLLNR